MKTALLGVFGLSLLFAARLPAAETFPAVPANGPQPAAVSTTQRTAAQLDELLGPIALYPDALIAIILPSATEASDVVLAARYFATQGDPAKVDDQPWDDSVRALAHYPDVVKWMDENLTWTKQVGEAFLDQPAEVMKAVQRLRAAARAAGTLVDTPQQRVVAADDVITIVPAQPDIIYVPSYDPEIVYLPRRDYNYPYYPSPFLTFGVGYATGFWLGYDLDWSRQRIWVTNRYERERYWRQHRQVPAIVVRPDPRWEHDGVHQVWNPNPNRARTYRPPYSGPARAVIVRPSPFQNDGRRDDGRRDGQRPPFSSVRPESPQLPRPPFDRGGARWGSGAAAPSAPGGMRTESAPSMTAPQTQVQPQPQPQPQSQPQRQMPTRPAPSYERSAHDQRMRDASAAPGRVLEVPRNAVGPAPINPPAMNAAAPNPRSGMISSATAPQRVMPAPERSAPAPAPAPASAPAAPAAQPPPPAARTQEMPAEARRSFSGRN